MFVFDVEQGNKLVCAIGLQVVEGYTGTLNDGIYAISGWAHGVSTRIMKHLSSIEHAPFPAL